MAGTAQATASTRRLELERRAFLDLVRMANTLATPEAIARQVVVVAKHLSACAAVAIRLKAGPGYRYAGQLGFPESFIRQEDDLCATDDHGHLLRNRQRQPILACLCGRVLTEQLSQSHPCSTDRGSFITSSTSLLLASHAELECLGRTRNRCHAAGYETVGLFPIRRDQVTYGLIQCNDPQPGKLTADAIDLIENLAATSAHLFQLAMT